MRRRPLFVFLLMLSPAGCRHDLTICHDENDGPACRDSAVVQDSAADEGEADGAPDVVGETSDSSISSDTSDTAEETVPVDSTIDSDAETDSSVVEDSSPADTAGAEVTVVDSTVSDTFVVDSAVLDTLVADTYVADTLVADTYVADTFAPDTSVADTFVPDTSAADTSVADTAPPCTLGSYSCGGAGGNELRRCGDSGPALVVTCPPGKCDAALGRCTACSPGAFSCSGAVRLVCDSYGSATSTVATCATPELCALSTGVSCMSPVCSASDVSCAPPSDPPAVHACNAGRTGYVDTPCAVTCSAASCLTVSAIAAGGGRGACALLSNGTVWCWDNALAPQEVPGLSGVTQIAVGDYAFGARLLDGTVRAWPLASGGASPPFAPGATTPVPGITGAQSLAIGPGHACVRISDGSVKCWGDDSSGELGPSIGSSFAPPAFYAPSGLLATGPMACGSSTSFAVVADGGRAWGKNDLGQLGIGSTGDRTSPTTAFPGAIAIAPGFGHACALTGAGNVLCAGGNYEGQLGDGAGGAPRSSPALVLGIDGQVAQLVSGFSHSCALLKDSTVRCWGSNGGGQVGDGSTTNRLYPVAVSGLTGVKQLAAGNDGTCALMNDQTTVKCWGSGYLRGPGATDSSVPVALKWR